MRLSFYAIASALAYLLAAWFLSETRADFFVFVAIAVVAVIVSEGDRIMAVLFRRS